MICNKNIYAAKLPHRAVSVYMYLCDRANKEGTCFPGLKTIARELNLSLSTVKRAIKDLEIGGFVRKNRRTRENNRGSTSNLYTLV